MARGRDDAPDPDDIEPTDVAAVRRDDAFVDAIAGDGPVATDSPEQYELALLLTNWRADALSAPMPAGPTLDEVVAAMPTQRESRRLRVVRPFAGAAAAAALVLGGATMVSVNAEPGDPLWGVKSVVFSQQADATLARTDVRADLDAAEAALAAGELDRAGVLIDSASLRLADIRDDGVRAELQAMLDQLIDEYDAAVEARQVGSSSPNSTVPSPRTSTADPQETTPAPPEPPTSGAVVVPPPPTSVPGQTEQTPSSSPTTTSSETPDISIMQAPVESSTTPGVPTTTAGGSPTTTTTTTPPPGS
ncbi:anti-sigma-D factor RsdA [Rhodococcus sp. HNM0569]|uniref:anti-sigma-D factor RsdA n=1 Tax=Rhodococcus sp. HNM0569 TaxID=2716340 RepID=UPI003211DD58